jgi:hypothetical protein
MVGRLSRCGRKGWSKPVIPREIIFAEIRKQLTSYSFHDSAAVTTSHVHIVVASDLWLSHALNDRAVLIVTFEKFAIC